MTSPAVVGDTAWAISTVLSYGSPGVLLSNVESVEIRDGIAPIVPSAKVLIKKALRVTAPNADATPPWSFPADTTSGGAIYDNFLSIVGGSLSLVYAIVRVSAQGHGASAQMTIEAQDPRSMRLARCVLAPRSGFGVYFPFNFNPNGVGNSTPTGPFSFDWTSGTLWTRGAAFEPIFQSVNQGTSTPSYQFTAANYLPLQSSIGAYDPTVTGSWDCDGFTAMEGVLTVLGARGRWSFYVPPSGNLALVDLAPTSGVTLDLTSFADLEDWSFEKDQTNRVSAVQVFAPGTVFVSTVYKVAGGSSLVPDWAPADVTTYNNGSGDIHSPAFQRFQIVDGSLATNGYALLDALPMDLSGAPSFGQTRQIQVYIKNASGQWSSWGGKVIIAVDGTTLEIRGGKAWTDAYQAATDVAVTVAYQSLAMNSQTVNGAATSGFSGMVLRRDVNAYAVTVNSSTVIGVSGYALTTTSSAASAYCGMTATNAINMATDLAALPLRQRPRLSWTRDGVILNHAPGTAIGPVTLPGLGTFTVNGPVRERIIRQSGKKASTQWIVDFPPLSQVGQV